MRDDRATGQGTRGQSGVDFVIGFGIFFVTLTFVLVLIPDLLSPFADQAGPVVADRAVETLASDLLASGTVGTLDETCTVEFFQAGGTTCAFDASRPTADIVGVSDEHQLNVTLERNVTTDPGTEVVCHDGSIDLDCSGGDTVLARGPDTPGYAQSVRSARRVVRVDGESLLLRLRTW